MKRQSCDSGYMCLSPQRTGTLYCSQGPARGWSSGNAGWKEAWLWRPTVGPDSKALPYPSQLPKQRGKSRAGCFGSRPHVAPWRSAMPSRFSLHHERFTSRSPGRLWSDCPASSMNKPSLRSQFMKGTLSQSSLSPCGFQLRRRMLLLEPLSSFKKDKERHCVQCFTSGLFFSLLQTVGCWKPCIYLWIACLCLYMEEGKDWKSQNYFYFSL